MKKSIFSPLLFALIFASCGEQPSAELPEENIPDEKLSLEELARKTVIAELNIPGTEKYDFQIHKAHLTPDDFEDAIILVNREEFARKLAKESGKEDQFKQTGFVGNYNYIFYYDGANHTVSRPIGIPSAAFIPLKITFENIQSEAFQDFMIDLRIKEAHYRNFYTVKNNAPKMVFQWPIYVMKEEGTEELNHLEFDSGTYSLVKDILVFPGETKSAFPADKNSNFELKTKPKGEPKYRFFYNPKEGKYFTNK